MSRAGWTGLRRGCGRSRRGGDGGVEDLQGVAVPDIACTEEVHLVAVAAVSEVVDVLAVAEAEAEM